MATFSHLYTQQEGPQSREQKGRGSLQQTGGALLHLSILTNQENFLSLVPANIPVLRNFPGGPT